MRIPGALALVAINAAAFTAASTVEMESDLFYATATRCATLSALPTKSDLSAELLPNDRFDGTVKLTASDASTETAGCVLHLKVRGKLQKAPSSDSGDAFAVARQVDEALVKLVASNVLRGSSDLEDLSLQRIQLKLGSDREYAVDMRAQTTGDATGELTLNGSGCDDFAGKDFLADLLPLGADGVSIVPGTKSVSECAVGVNILGRMAQVSSTGEAVAFLKTLDDSLNEWFGESAAKPATVTLASAHVAFSPVKTETKAKTTNFAVAELSSVPTKNIMLGLLCGMTVLCAMLFGVAYQKKRHEQSLQERHHNASRAAQIRRVSYRMGYEPVHSHASHHNSFGAEEEEKDGLL